MKQSILIPLVLLSSSFLAFEEASAAAVSPSIEISFRWEEICGIVSTESTLQEVPPFPDAPKDISSVVTLASGTEPGERIVITGTVYRADRKTPFAGLVLYLYQTDAGGYYNRNNGGWRQAKINGWVKTDKNGRYEIRTIKPGQYPGGRIPAHIHAIVKLSGETPKWINDFLFDGDSHLQKEDYEKFASSGTFSSIMKAAKGNDGALRYVRDIRISTGRTPD